MMFVRHDYDWCVKLLKLLSLLIEKLFNSLLLVKISNLSRNYL